MKEDDFKLKRKKPTLEARIESSFGPARSTDDFFEPSIDSKIIRAKKIIKTLKAISKKD